MNTTRRTKRAARAVVAVTAAVLVAIAPGCARDLRAERDGKKAGEALCDLRDADEQGDVQSALAELDNQLSDLATKYAVFTAEDRADIRENLSDLAEHVAGGNTELAQQDLAVLQRSFENIRDDVGDTGRAAIDGFFQGIDDCVEA